MWALVLCDCDLRPDVPVSSARQCLDPTLSAGFFLQHSPQRADLDCQIAVLDSETGPRSFDKRILRDQNPWSADQRLKQGDVATARLFYERAADGGDGPAALRLGNTLDPNYLSHWGVLGLQPDVAAAAKWYRRARDLGEAAADLDLAALPQQ